MNLTRIDTYAILPVSKAAYHEIADKLKDAGYDQAFHSDGADGIVLDMHGIALSLDRDEAKETHEATQDPVEARTALVLAALTRLPASDDPLDRHGLLKLVAGLLVDLQTAYYERMSSTPWDATADAVYTRAERVATALGITADGVSELADALQEYEKEGETA